MTEQQRAILELARHKTICVAHFNRGEAMSGLTSYQFVEKNAEYVTKIEELEKERDTDIHGGDFGIISLLRLCNQ